MREWQLSQNQPLSLLIGADQRLARQGTAENHLWELVLNGGEPAAMALQTTYGLRARLMRVFPTFFENGKLMTDAQHCHQKPLITRFFPNFLQLQFAPFESIQVNAAYWVSDGQTLCGQMVIHNSGSTIREITVSQAALLNPLGNGSAFHAENFGMHAILQGQTGSLCPVLHMTGGADAVASPYPALSLSLQFLPDTPVTIRWCLASLPGVKESYEKARQMVETDWQTEWARLEMHNAAHTLDVDCGNADWDAAFALAQKDAQLLVYPQTSQPQHWAAASAISPDKNFMADDDIMGNGDALTNFEFYTLVQLLLPASADLATALLQNFLSNAQDGKIHFKIGSSTDARRHQALPMMAQLAWQIFTVSQKKTLLEAAWQPLLDNFNTWFNQSQDHDLDGCPELSDALQLGLVQAFLFDPWLEGSHAVRITTTEGAMLPAMLLKEAQALHEIAQVLSLPCPQLAQHQVQLKQHLTDLWDASEKTFAWRDRDTHQRQKGKTIKRISGNGTFTINENWQQARRMCIQIHSADEMTRVCKLTLLGMDDQAQPITETISGWAIQWVLGRAVITTENCYTQLNRIETSGLHPKDKISIALVDHHLADITTLAAMDAGVLEKADLNKIIKTWVNPKNEFFKYGIPEYLKSNTAIIKNSNPQINLFWNCRIVEGLIKLGYRQEAAALFTRLMQPIINTLKAHHAFYEGYHAKHGQGMGKRNALAGYAPLGTFLKLVGIEIQSNTRLIVSGENPFPGNVQVMFRGLCVEREGSHTLITFANGETMTLDGSESQLVTLT